jgi:hypothetical protein
MHAVAVMSITWANVGLFLRRTRWGDEGAMMVFD